MKSEKREKELIKDIKKRKRKSLEILVDNYGEKLMQYIFSITNDMEISEDIFQITWIKVMEKIDTFNENMPFSPWLFRIARNSAYDHIKRGKKKVKLDRAKNLKLEENIEDKLEKKDLISKLLSLLNESQREIIFLRFFEEKNYNEISEILRIPIGTVKSRLKRSIEFLGKFYREIEVNKNEKRL